MINYPKNYAPLAEEEMEYTSGGLSINWMALGSTVMGLATSMLAYLNVSNIAGVVARDFLAVGAQTRSLAIGTRRKTIVDDLLLHAASDFLKRETQADSHVAALFANGATAACRSAEKRRENVAHTAEAAAEQVFKVNVTAAVGALTTACTGNGAESIILGTLVRVRENIVGLVELLELLLGIGSLVHVRMKLARLMPERFFNLRLRCIVRYAEHLVQILGH